MKLNEAKQARTGVAQKCQENGDRVEQIMREADVVEGEVQEMIRRFSQRLKRYRDSLAERLDAAAANAEVGDGDGGGD